MQLVINDIREKYPDAEDKDNYLIQKVNSILDFVTAGVDELIAFNVEFTSLHVNIARQLYLPLKTLNAIKEQIINLLKSPEEVRTILLQDKISESFAAIEELWVYMEDESVCSDGQDRWGHEN